MTLAMTKRGDASARDAVCSYSVFLRQALLLSLVIVVSPEASFTAQILSAILLLLQLCHQI